MDYRSCAFTCCNDDYVPKAIVSLKSVDKWNHPLDLFVIGRSFSNGMKSLLTTYGIKFVEIDWSCYFPTEWEYPAECFYWLGASELFMKLGYHSAVYLDADVYCNGDISHQLRTVSTISGVNGGSLRGILGAHYDALGNIIGSLHDGNRIQSGVVFMNMDFLNKFHILEKASTLYKQCLEAGLPRKGDDSLLALLIAKYYPLLKPRFLVAEYNKIPWEKPPMTLVSTAEVDHFKPSQTIFFHFTATAPKPWDFRVNYPTQESMYFASKWKHLAIDAFSKDDLYSYFPCLAKALSKRHLKFYWYPSSNVGDLLTPYFLSRAGYDPGAYRVSEKKIARLDRWSLLIKKLNLLWPRKLGLASYVVAVGSVVRVCGAGALVFGSGIRSRWQPVQHANIRFVRGPLTRSRYLEEGVPCPPEYGDPGLLLPRLFNPHVPKRFKLGIIPHFTEYKDVACAYKGCTDLLIIDMGCGDLEKVISEILGCERTVSSSLHGLVFSHAYGIPTQHIKISNGIFGDGTKFDDYYQGIDMVHQFEDFTDRFQRGEPPSMEELIILAKEKLEDYDDRRLWDSFFIEHDGGGFKLRRSLQYPF